jgi:DNA polymerase-3 subunit beta
LILRESSDEKLYLESDGRSTLVRGQRSEFRLPSENPDEFPDVKGFEEEKYHELPARFFREIVRRTAFATDNESSRYALGGVLLELGEDCITAVGTDGRRLARQEGPVRAVGGQQGPAEQRAPTNQPPAGAQGSGETMTIVPTRAMNLLDKALADNEEDIQLATRSNDILVKSGKTTIYSRLVEGRFPRWRDVFPHRDNPVRIDMVTGPFHAAVRQAMIVTSEERRGVDFTFAEGKVVLSCRGAEKGESHVELPVAYDGTPRVVTLDPRFVGDFLRVLDPEQTFVLELQDAESAVVCNTEDGYSYVIMPLARDR